MQDERKKLQVFEPGGAYLATKKIEKNNPKADRMEADNRYRKWRNDTVDRVLVARIPETQILMIKKVEISDKVRSSIKKNGNNPDLFVGIISLAVAALQLLIRQMLEKASVAVSGNLQSVEQERDQQRKSPMAEKYPSLLEIKRELSRKNFAINEKQLEKVKKELANTKGFFKVKLRKQLQEQIGKLEKEITNLNHQLPQIVQKHGYRTVQEFLKELKGAEIEYKIYEELNRNKRKQEVRAPKSKPSGHKRSVMERLREKQDEIRKQDQQKIRTYTPKRDRDAR